MAEVEWTRQHWHGRGNPAHGCVQYATAGDLVAIRDSKDPDGPMLTFDHDSWRAFIAAVKAGEFDRWAGGLPRTC